MNIDTARHKWATLSLYTTSGTTDTAPMLTFAGCQNSTALTSLHCPIRSRVEVILLMCAISMLVGASRNCSRFVCRYGFHEDVLDSDYVPILLYCCTRIQYFALARFYQTRANGCIETKFRHHNECTQHVVSLHGGHVMPSALRSLTASVKVIVVWNSWSRRYPPQMRENLLPVRIIRRQKATTSEDTCTNHPVYSTVEGALGLE